MLIKPERFFKNIKRAALFIKNKGLRYAYNKWWLDSFYATSSRPYLLIFQKIFSVFNHAPYPGLIEIEISTLCNLKCTICEHTYWDEPENNMSFKEFKSIVDQFPRLKWIALTGIGQVFLNQDALEMYRYLKSKWPRIFIELYDPFYLIDEKLARHIIEIGIDNVFISLDAATKETYQKIRIGSDFDRVINNVKTFMRLRKEMGRPLSEVRFNFVVTKDNIHEISGYIDLVRSLGGTSILFTKMSHLYREVEKLFVDIPPELIKRIEKEAGRLNIEIKWCPNERLRSMPIKYCTAWIMPFIYVTGEVVPCCAVNEANARKFQKENSLGNVFKKSFKEIWLSQEYGKFRAMLKENQVPELCSDCPVFSMGGLRI